MLMKIKKLMEEKYKLEDTLEGLERVSSIAGDGHGLKISITTAQANKIGDLLNGYKKLLDHILDTAEIDL